MADEGEIESKEEKKETLEAYRQRMREFYDKFSFDIKNLKFDRDELYDR